ncbi:MAG: alcohol dehydrogenase AdhP [Ilumatobacteraceae bacterium]
MKAALVTKFTEPLTIVERDIPDPGPGQILVRIEACGLCHTDIHAANGDWPFKPTLPFVPGHEGIGMVEKLGASVTNRAIGDRVAIPWLGYACGECRYCIDGRETLCEKQEDSGYSIDGAFADYAVASAKYVVAVPAGISSIEAAPLSCAGVTTYKALKVAKIVPAENVAVFGIGGLGHLGVQYARIMGANVIAVDIEDEKLQLATELGADHTVNARTVDPVQAIHELGGADVALVLAASTTVFEQAFASLRRGGRLICVAMPAEETMSIPIFDTVVKGISVIGSIVGTRQDVAEVFALHAAGKTKVIAETRKIEDVNQAMADVLSSKVPARLVFEF